jgi:hypothetical protein
MLLNVLSFTPDRVISFEPVRARYVRYYTSGALYSGHRPLVGFLELDVFVVSTASDGPCEACPVGKYANVSAATACYLCNHHSTSEPSSDQPTDCKCNHGYTGPDGIASFKGCLEGWTQVQDQCFRFFDVPMSYPQARQSCRDLGGDLALPTNAEQQKAFLDLMPSKKTAWIGIESLASRGAYLSTKREALSYTAWSDTTSTWDTLTDLHPVMSSAISTYAHMHDVR